MTPHRRLLSIVAIGWVLAATGIDASTGAPEDHPTLEAAAASESPAFHVDGRFTEDAWQRAEMVRSFRQRDPDDGAEPTFPTEARVSYDATAVYIAVRAFDPEPALIVGHLTRRDEPSPSDWIHVAIDSFLDHHTAYEFGVNAAGVKQDRYRFNDQDEDVGWDAVWDVAVSTDETGWQAEFRVPFSQLRFPAVARPTFGLAIVRQIGRLNETSSWPHLPKGATGYVSSFAHLSGLELTRATRRLELIPYTVAELETRSGEDAAAAGSVDPAGELGLDLRYALTPGLTLTGTINPDFGQVEADPAVVNLSAFETFFSERRPFFVEGSGIFRFDVDCNDGQCTGLFYSRRIGRAPQGDPEAPDGAETFVPAQTTILGAAKMTGRAGGFSIGAMHAVSSEERARVDAGGLRRSPAVEPLTAYTVIRARREFEDQSSLGFITTATNRRLVDGVRFLPHAAYTGGIDADWRLGRAYSLSGFWAASAIAGSAGAIERLQRNNVHVFQRPDAGHVAFDPSRTSLRGHAGALSIGKIAGERTRFNSHVSFKSPGFDINDVGFMRRADTRSLSNWLQWRFDRPTGWRRSFRVNFNQWAGWNFDGDRLYSGANVNAHVTFANNWRTGAGLNVNGREFDDRLTRGGPGGFREGTTGVWSYVNTDDRRIVSVGASSWIGSDGHGSSELNVSPSVTLRPSSSLSLNVGMRYNRNRDAAQWIERVEGTRDHFVFGELDQTTVSLTSRLSYTLTSNLSLQLYAEPFVSAGDYTSFKELADGRAARFEDRYTPFAHTGNPDFTRTSFRTTNVLRWEYRPGSTLFLVWQQAREAETDRGRLVLGRDAGAIFSAPAQNVFLVKLTYWFTN